MEKELVIIINQNRDHNDDQSIVITSKDRAEEYCELFNQKYKQEQEINHSQYRHNIGYLPFNLDSEFIYYRYGNGHRNIKSEKFDYDAIKMKDEINKLKLINLQKMNKLKEETLKKDLEKISKLEQELNELNKKYNK